MQSCIIEQDYSKQKQFEYFLCSDIHFGSTGQDKSLLKKDFDDAKRRGAMIFINGDWGDFIMSGDRKRYSPSADAYGTDNNINMTINEAFDFFSEYVDNIAMIGTGNHETSVSRFHHFDPTQQLIYSLNKAHKSKIIHGQYSGFIMLRYMHGKNGRVRAYTIYYNHGQGGTAEISKGTIDINRHMTTKDADLIWLGHKHTKILLPSEYIIGVNRVGEIVERERAGIITGAYVKIANKYDAMKKGYKMDYGEERMRGLQATGGAYLKIDLSGEELTRKFEL